MLLMESKVCKANYILEGIDPLKVARFAFLSTELKIESINS